MKMVAPLVGAWIEISEQTPKQRADTSLLSWERGLKCVPAQNPFQLQQVAPLVGAWIEIFAPFTPVTGVPVAPLVGAWIEILLPTNIAPTGDLSLLSWERGLK